MSRADHGTRAGYQQGCRCRLCILANASYQSRWRATRRGGQLLLGASVSATEAKRLLRHLLIEQYPRAELARRLGLRNRALRVDHQATVTLRTALKLRRLYRTVTSEDGGVEDSV